MRWNHLEHILSAAANVTGELEFVVIGSQAILGSHPDALPQLLRSMEADLYPTAAPERADEIDGALGDGSQFHRAFAPSHNTHTRCERVVRARGPVSVFACNRFARRCTAATSGVERETALAWGWEHDQAHPAPHAGQVGATGFEPATFRSQSGCATKLRHAPARAESIAVDSAEITALDWLIASARIKPIS
jgi:hypothetical protein